MTSIKPVKPMDQAVTDLLLERGWYRIDAQENKQGEMLEWQHALRDGKLPVGWLGAILEQGDFELAAGELPALVHALESGRARCQFHPGVPGQWPEGQKWARDATDITCPGCKNQEALAFVPVPVPAPAPVTAVQHGALLTLAQGLFAHAAGLEPDADLRVFGLWNRVDEETKDKRARAEAWARRLVDALKIR